MLYCNYSIATLKWLKSIKSDKGHDAIPSKSAFHQQEHENFQIAMSKLTLKKNYVHTQNRQHLLQSTTSYISIKGVVKNKNKNEVKRINQAHGTRIE